MMYPLMVLAFATLVLIGMLLFLVPIFVEIFAQLGGDLPMLTQIVVKASNIVRCQLVHPLPAIVGIVIFGFLRYKKTERDGARGTGTAMQAPAGIGESILKIGMARFSRTLSTLVGVGRRHHPRARDHRHDLRQQPHRGRRRQRPRAGPPGRADRRSRSPSRRSSRRWSRTWCASARRPESSRRCSSKIADFYEDEVDSAIATLTSIIEPLMMIGVGIMVGIIIISMYLPMFKILTLIGGS